MKEGRSQIRSNENLMDRNNSRGGPVLQRHFHLRMMTTIEATGNHVHPIEVMKVLLGRRVSSKAGDQTMSFLTTAIMVEEVIPKI